MTGRTIGSGVAGACGSAAAEIARAGRRTSIRDKLSDIVINNSIDTDEPEFFRGQ